MEPALPGRIPPARLAPPRPRRTWWRGLLALVMLYLFVCAIKMMGTGLKLIGEEHHDDVQSVLASTDNPFVGLVIGILITSIFQSSSFTSSLTVGVAATGELTLAQAIPIVMGANIGTTVTNTLVSLGHYRNRREFRRATSCSMLHDSFNLMTVTLLMPVELISRALLEAEGGIIYLAANSLAELFNRPIDKPPPNFVKAITAPVVDAVEWLFGSLIDLGTTWTGVLLATAAVGMLFTALVFLVRNLRALMQTRLEGLFGRFVFRYPFTGFLVGLIITVSVQSSSVTTSMIVPLVGAGMLTTVQVFPYMLGANIGTTVTALIAAGAAGVHIGLAVALAHLIFNLAGTAVFWPLRRIPLRIAELYATVVARRRYVAPIYIVVTFFILPLLCILIFG